MSAITATPAASVAAPIVLRNKVVPRNEFEFVFDSNNQRDDTDFEETMEYLYQPYQPYTINMPSPVVKILDWLSLDKLDWCQLSRNPAAMRLLEANPTKICWPSLSRNPAAMHLLIANMDKIDWQMLSMNPAAIELLEANMDKINWHTLAMNPNGLHLFEMMPNIDYELYGEYLCNPHAAAFIEANIDLIKEKHSKKVFRYVGSNPAVAHLLETKLEFIPIRYWSSNPNVVQFFTNSNIDHYYIAANPNIFISKEDNPNRMVTDRPDSFFTSLMNMLPSWF